MHLARRCRRRLLRSCGYPSKMPVTAVHVMNHDVLPTFETARARIDVVLSDNGREFCGRPDRHSYELFLQLQTSSIAPRRSTARSPTASWKGSTEPCSMNTSGSTAGAPRSRRSTRCRWRWKSTSSPQALATAPGASHERTHPLAGVPGGPAAMSENQPKGPTGEAKGNLNDPPPGSSLRGGMVRR